MCNKDAGYPPVAVCSCGATFYDCQDDRVEAFKHITQASSPSHKWTYVKVGYSFPNPVRLDTSVYHEYPWYYYVDVEQYLQEERRITQMNVLHPSTREYYMKEFYSEARALG